MAKIYGDCLSCTCTYSEGCKYDRAAIEFANRRAAARRLAELQKPVTERRRGSSAGTGFRQKMRAFKAAQLAEITGETAQ